MSDQNKEKLLFSCEEKCKKKYVNSKWYGLILDSVIDTESHDHMQTFSKKWDWLDDIQNVIINFTAKMNDVIEKNG